MSTGLKHVGQIRASRSGYKVGSVGAARKSGWMNSDSFVSYLHLHKKHQLLQGQQSTTDHGQPQHSVELEVVDVAI